MVKKGQIFRKHSPEFKWLKVEMYYDEMYESVDAFIKNYTNTSLKLKMSPVKYRTLSQYI